VNNEAHAWVEAYVPAAQGGYWTRLDLGGWNVPLDAHQATPTEHFRSRNADPFPRPAQYDNQYSVASDVAPNGAALADGGAPPPSAPAAPAATEEGATASSAQGGAASGGAGASGAPATTSAGVAGGAARGAGARAVSVARGAAPGTTGDATGDEGEGVGDDDVLGTVLSLDLLRADDGGGVGGSSEATSGFVRGTMLRVEGGAHDEHGLGVGGMSVEVHLVRNRADDRTLGTTVTRPDGRWEVRVLLPGDLSAGEYTVRVSTPGDAHHAAASAE
jgi:hypothetical protein